MPRQHAGIQKGQTVNKCPRSGFLNRIPLKFGSGLIFTLVPRVGLEPTLLAEPDFESGASTNFTTRAGVSPKA